MPEKDGKFAEATSPTPSDTADAGKGWKICGNKPPNFIGFDNNRNRMESLCQNPTKQ